MDDGSVDHTAQVCEEFGAFVRYVHQKNSGLPAARNTGIGLASGEWIALCDSDDLWRPRKLEIQLAVLEATGASWSITDFEIIDPSGIVRSREGDSFSRAFALFEETGVAAAAHFDRWLRKTRIPAGSDVVTVYTGDAFGMLFEGNVALPSTAMISREVIARTGGFDARFAAEETEFFHRLAAREPVAIVMKHLACYRVGNPSLIQGPPIPFIEAALTSVEQARALRPRLTPEEAAAYHSGRRRLLTRLAYAHLSVLDRAGARRAAYQAMAEDAMRSPALLGIVAASFLPAPGLRALHKVKRALARSGSDE